MPDAGVAAGSLDWRKAWTVVASTVLRPCTGALIVLVFSISQKLLLAGIAATLIMGLGTAITVASLAILAVSARETAFVLTKADSQLGRRIVRASRPAERRRCSRLVRSYSREMFCCSTCTTRDVSEANHALRSSLISFDSSRAMQSIQFQCAVAHRRSLSFGFDACVPCRNERIVVACIRAQAPHPP
jgi:hypothetical protein